MSQLRKRHFRVVAPLAVACVVAAVAAGSTAHGASKNSTIAFSMVRSAAATNAGCLPNASARVTVHSIGPVEVMTVKVSGLPAEHRLRLLRHPGAERAVRPVLVPGRHRDRRRMGPDQGVFIGRFNIETFIVAPGSAPAPVVHNQRRSRTPARTRPPRPCTRSTWACGSTRPPTPSRPAAPAPSRRSTANTTPASRRSAPAIPPTTKARFAS